MLNKYISSFKEFFLLYALERLITDHSDPDCDNFACLDEFFADFFRDEDSFVPRDDSRKKLRLAATWAFTERKSKSCEEWAKRCQEIGESELFAVEVMQFCDANKKKIDLIDFLEGFVYLTLPEKKSQRVLIEFLLEQFYLFETPNKFENFVVSPSHEYNETLRERKKELPPLPTRRPCSVPPPEHIKILIGQDFTVNYQILEEIFAYFDYYFPLMENLPLMKAKQLSKKITKISSAYTWKENAKLFGDKLAFALLEPQHPPLMVLHGTTYMLLENCCQEIAKTLQKYDNYQILTLDGRRFAGRNEEPYPLFGSPSVWSGSRPGQLTSFVYDNPKSVIIIHHADKMNPVMFETLAGAFKNKNIISDEYGLENRNRDRRDAAMPATPVDFSQTVFILTTSTGSHLYERLDIDHFSQEMLEMRAFAGLEGAMFTPAGRAESNDPTFSREFLDLMWAGFVAMPPLNITDRIEYFLPKLQNEFKTQGKKLNLEIKCGKKQLKVIAAALLLSERHNKRDSSDLVNEMIRPVYMSEKETGTKMTLSIAPEAEAALAPYLKMAQPQSYLLKRGKILTPVFVAEGEKLVLKEIKTEKAFRQKDHEGNIRLLADYPETRFSDIYGHSKIKEKLQEILELLQSGNSSDTQRGILLAGEPGVGKTLIAEAFAGEAQMAFVNITGSELLYSDATARLQEILEKHSPCVVFIDEADSIPSRVSNSDFAPAVNRLLAMIQGINTDENQAFWILATNYPERLDEALLRAGRIEDTLHMRAPRDFAARAEYLQHFPLSDKQREILAKITIGFTGAMFEQLHRKTKRLRRLQKNISKKDLYQLVIEIQHGDDMNSRPATPEYERCTAYHEAGHAVAQLCLGIGSAHLMLVLHNGEAVSGYLQTIDEEVRDRTPDSVINDLVVYLAGRAAEELIFGTATMGCSSDLKRAGELAYYAAAKVGFVPEKTGLYISPVQYKAEEMALCYEKAAAEMVEKAWQKAQTLLAAQEPLLREIAEKLLKKRLLDNDELRKLHQKFNEDGKNDI